MRKYLTQSHVVWLLVHLVLFLVGVVLISSGFLDHFFATGTSAAIGGSLAASGAAGYVIYFYIYSSDETRQRLDTIWKAGIQNVFNGRSVLIKEQYSDRIQKAHTIDIIGFGLSAFQQDYGDKLGDFSKTKKIRIILLDPSFPSEKYSYAHQRDLEEENVKDRIPSDIRHFLRATADARTRSENFSIRLMRALPSINYFRMDDEVLWGPYLIGMQSRNMPTILVRRGGYLFDALTRHFDSLWSDERFCAPPPNE